MPMSKEFRDRLYPAHDTGAHGIAMGFNYNGRKRSQELLWWDSDDTVERIRRAETDDDLVRTFERGKLLPINHTI